jgi:GntR family transcriptional regulator
MRLDKLTTQFQQALSDAQSLTLAHDNQYIEPVHLLAAVVAQADGSGRALLERSGVVADRAGQTISATLAGPETAAALDVEIGSALISLTRVVVDAEGCGIEHLSALYRPDMHAFHMDMLRTGDGANRHWRPTASGLPRLTPPLNPTGIQTTAAKSDRRGPTTARRRP